MEFKDSLCFNCHRRETCILIQLEGDPEPLVNYCRDIGKMIDRGTGKIVDIPAKSANSEALPKDTKEVLKEPSN